MRGRALALVVSVVLAWVGSARAQSSVPWLDVSSCPETSVPDVSAAIDVELSGASAPTRDAIAAGEIHAELSCDAEQVVVHVHHATEELSERVATAGPALPRRIAMVMGELLDAITTRPAPAIPPAPTPSPTLEPVAPPHDRARLRLAGGVWSGGAPWVPLGSVEAGLEYDPLDAIAIVGGLSAAFGATSASDAHLDVRLFSAALSLRIGATWGGIWLGGGPAIRGGLVSFSGSPADPTGAVGHDALAGWLGLGAVASLWVPFAGTPVRVGVEIEGGGIAVGANAIVFDRIAQQIGGGFVDARVGLDVALDGTNS